jgi:hypothetical protein
VEITKRDQMKDETATNLVLPVVHLNGTSRRALIEQRCAAALAIGKAIEGLNRMSPHGRDYYPVPGLLEAALDQYRRRVTVLRALLAEVESEIAALDE